MTLRAVSSPEKELAARSVFGVAAGVLPAHPDDLLECARNLSAVEIPAETPDPAPFFERFETVHAGNLIDPELAENLPSAGKQLRADSAECMIRTVEELSAKGFRTASLNLGICYPQESRSARRNALELLKSLGFVLEKNAFTLLLPFTVPARGGESPCEAAEFLRETLLPRFKIRLNVHPHELKPGFRPEVLAGGGAAPEIRAVHFVYNADSGNILVPEHVRPWIGYLSLHGFRGPYFSAPVTAGGDAAGLCDACSELVKKLGS